MTALPPPPRREIVAPSLDTLPSSTSFATSTTVKDTATKKKEKAAWRKKAEQKAFLLSDKIGVHVNNAAVKLGSERIFPVSNDAVAELEKCARLVQSFTKQPKLDPSAKTDRKHYIQIPPTLIKNCKGIVIFSSLRTGIAPLGGAGGAGIVMAHNDDGTWSPPSFISPNNLSAGFMLGVDIYDCIFIIRTEEALASFYGTKVTLGGELAVVAGPIGAGAAVETGLDKAYKAPLLSYIKSRGAYAGVEAVAQVFVQRWEENGFFYNHPGITSKEILTGTIRFPPPEVALIHKALAAAEALDAD